MNGKNLQEKSTDELLQQAKLTKLVTGVLSGMLLALFGIGVFLAFRQGFNMLISVPFALLPIVLMNVRSLKDIKKELSSRGESQA